MSYFPELHTNKSKREDELDLYNYVTKSALKDAAGVDASQFAKKDDIQLT